jgi:aminoglycoside phosphotransferase (APT) family kinase protein
MFAPEKLTKSEEASANRAEVSLTNPQTNKVRRAVAIERLVLSVAESLYRAKPQVKSYGASSSGVWDLHFGGERGDRVIKIGIESPTALLREQSIARELHKLDLAVPEIEFSQQDLPNVWFPFMVMPKVADTTLKEASLENMPFAIEGCYKAGEFLAKLQQITLDRVPLLPDLSYMALSSEPSDHQRWQKIIATLRQWQILTPPIQNILARVETIIDRRDYPNIVHQDFIPRQILVGSQQFAVIDWESATIGRTFLDLGDFLGSIRRSLRKRENRREYVSNFIAGFSNNRSLSDTDRSEIALWEAYSHIRAAIEQGHKKKRDKTQRLLGFATEAFPQ